MMDACARRCCVPAAPLAGCRLGHGSEQVTLLNHTHTPAFPMPVADFDTTLVHCMSKLFLESSLMTPAPMAFPWSGVDRPA